MKTGRVLAWGSCAWTFGGPLLAVLAASCDVSVSGTDGGGGEAGAPTAAFGAAGNVGDAPLRVAFSDQSTGAVTSWAWTFGDGGTSSLSDPTHVYTVPGTYSVVLTVTGPGGSDTLTRADLVHALEGVGAPTAAFDASGNTGNAPLAVSFFDGSTGSVTSRSWAFGDGGTSSQTNPTHTYTTAGTYSVSLTVTGPGGSNTLTRPGLVQVGSAGPTAAFGATGNTGDAPLMVVFTDQSTGSVTSWRWTFGDGATSSQSDPVHTYGVPGTYSVTLAVTGPNGSNSLTRTDLVRVFDGNRQGIWASSREVALLPMSGSAWNSLLAEANRAAGTPDVSNQDDNTDVRVLAKALVFARNGDQRYRQEVIAACMAAIDTELGGRTLALGRNLIGYVLSADLVGLPGAEDTLFRDWLRRCRTENLQGMTLVSTHEERPNNWGTHAGASRAAVALYLNDTADLARCAQVFRGWLGDRGAYAGFSYGDLAWQADPAHPVGINPRNATLSGHSVDGVLPDDQRRAGGFAWPPPKENYVWEAMQGALAQAVILSRAGYDTWGWSDQALLRAVSWLHVQCNFPAGGDDTWEPHVVNYFYAAGFPAPVPSNPGKNVGWTDWTLQ